MNTPATSTKPNLYLTAKRTTGTHGRGSTIYEAVNRDGTTVTAQQAMEAQARGGYHPAGYGFYAFKILPNGRAQWERSNSCD